MPLALLLGAGLSPRVRGNRARAGTERQELGSIPACAGEPCPFQRVARGRWVYPRVCGGTRRARAIKDAIDGLSPRVRGNPVADEVLTINCGSIPACAGEPVPHGRGVSPGWVYPRVCGGTVAMEHTLPAMPGLSPRVRGNPAARCGSPSSSRSIPACAGEPCICSGGDCLTRVYPRVCGGTPQRRKYRRRLQGLSPRVRGNPWPARWQAMVYWSIPACAGEPSPPPGQSQLPSVYPRVCGGTGGCGTGDCVPVGLSPRVRGNPSAAPPPSASPGSIPACAGEPAAQNLHRPEARVYPRVCGGTPHPRPPAPQQPGLSPRVRGNPQVLHRNILRLRSIPACAEEPRTPWRRKRWARVYPRVCGGTCWRRRRQ